MKIFVLLVIVAQLAVALGQFNRPFSSAASRFGGGGGGGEDGRYHPRSGDDGHYHHPDRQHDGHYNPDNRGQYHHEGDERAKYHHEGEGTGQYHHQGEGTGQYHHQGEGSGQYHHQGESSGKYQAATASSNLRPNVFAAPAQAQAQAQRQRQQSFGQSAASRFAPPTGNKIIRWEKTQDPFSNNYRYLYETENKILGEEAGNFNPDLTANGYYEYIGDDGQKYRVDYTANDRGFVPKGAHLPPGIEKAVEYLARNS